MSHAEVCAVISVAGALLAWAGAVMAHAGRGRGERTDDRWDGRSRN
jgi:hypothetical protein